MMAGRTELMSDGFDIRRGPVAFITKRFEPRDALVEELSRRHKSDRIIEVIRAFVACFGNCNNIRASDCSRMDGNGWIVAGMAFRIALFIGAIGRLQRALQTNTMKEGLRFRMPIRAVLIGQRRRHDMLGIGKK